MGLLDVPASGEKGGLLLQSLDCTPKFGTRKPEASALILVYHSRLWHSPVLHYTILDSTLIYHTILYYTILYYTVPYCIVLHYTSPYLLYQMNHLR